MSLISILGSPFVDSPLPARGDSELLDVFTDAFRNRVGLLYLALHRRADWDPRLEDRYQELRAREHRTIKVIASLARVLNEGFREQYVIFKSVKPYPATPNDTDVVCLGPHSVYEEMYSALLARGYHFHEWAPQQRTVYDPGGVGQIGAGKKGGTYYIDLYEEISTDYFSYMDKRRLVPFVVRKELEGVPVNLLRPEPELAIVMFHSVFPERTFQLEHFYYPLYVLRAPHFDLELFLRFAIDSGVAFAVKTESSLIAQLHERHFGFVPRPIQKILDVLGSNDREVRRFSEQGGTTPYLFSPRTFWTAFLLKSVEWHSFRSLLIQGFRMLDPRFFRDVMRSIRMRMSEKGAYHLE